MTFYKVSYKTQFLAFDKGAFHFKTANLAFFILIPHFQFHLALSVVVSPVTLLLYTATMILLNLLKVSKRYRLVQLCYITEIFKEWDLRGQQGKKRVGSLYQSPSEGFLVSFELFMPESSQCWEIPHKLSDLVKVYDLNCGFFSIGCNAVDCEYQVFIFHSEVQDKMLA